MSERHVLIAELERLRQARNLHEVWTILNGDQFFEFQTAYASVTGVSADPYDENPANEARIRATLDCLVAGVDVLNQILALDEGTEDSDQRRCQALLRILQDEAEPGTPRDRWTPLQRLLIDLARKGAAHFTGLAHQEARKKLVVIP